MVGHRAGAVGRRCDAGGDELRGVQLRDKVHGAASLRLDELVGGAVPDPLGGKRRRHAAGRGVRLHDRQMAAGAIIYAVVNAAVYAIVVLIGALIPVKFLISFELLILFAAPTILIFFIVNGWRYARLRDGMDLALLGAWVWLVLTLGAYFLYLTLGITPTLWAEASGSPRTTSCTSA